MGGYRPLPGMEFHLQRRIEFRHDDVPVFIRKRQADPVIALLDLLKPEPSRDGALRMRDRRLERAQRVERADDIQLARMFGRRIAEREDFQLHDRQFDSESLAENELNPSRESPTP